MAVMIATGPYARLCFAATPLVATTFCRNASIVVFVYCATQTLRRRSVPRMRLPHVLYKPLLSRYIFLWCTCISAIVSYACAEVTREFVSHILYARAQIIQSATLNGRVQMECLS